MADVIDIKKPEKWRDVVKTLRYIADEVESGKFGTVEVCVVNLLSKESSLATFGIGPNAGDLEVLAVMAMGQHVMIQDLSGD